MAGESPSPPSRRIGDAGTEENNRGGEPSTRSTVLRSGLLTHDAFVPPARVDRGARAPPLGNDGEGLPTMKRDGSPSTLRETGEARKREQGFRALSCGRGSIAREGVLARLPHSEHGSGELPGNGQVSLQKSFGGVLVQRSAGSFTSHKSWCGVRDRGPSPRSRSSVETRCSGPR
jgi:hypothetical protein